MSCYAGRSRTRSPGSGSAASPWAAGCPSDHPGQAHPPGGRAGVEELNQALLARAAEHKRLRTHKLWADTVVAANVAYPTDLGLLARAVDKLHTTARRVQAAGVRPAPGSGTVDGRPAVAPTRSPGPCGRAPRKPAGRVRGHRAGR